jgi:hypothetical protein
MGDVDVVKIPALQEPLVPLSVLSLDLPAPAGVDWTTYLSGRHQGATRRYRQVERLS